MSFAVWGLVLLEEAARGDGAAQTHVCPGGSGPEEECVVLVFAYIETFLLGCLGWDREEGVPGT